MLNLLSKSSLLHINHSSIFLSPSTYFLFLDPPSKVEYARLTSQEGNETLQPKSLSM